MAFRNSLPVMMFSATIAFARFDVSEVHMGPFLWNRSCRSNVLFLSCYNTLIRTIYVYGLLGTFSMPLYTVYILSVKTWPLGEILCDLWLSLDYTACLCSIYTVFCITVDRFCSIRLPARYRMWRTERKVSC